MTGYAGVIGAGGKTGTRIVQSLTEHGIRVRGLVNSRQGAASARAAGAQDTVPIDLRDPGTWAPAVHGLTSLVFIAPPFDAQEDQHAASALAAAAAAGVEQFVYYSILHPSFSGVPHHLRKLAAETAVRDSGLIWTILQPTMYQQTFLAAVRSARDGVLRASSDPSRYFNLVDLDDIAEVAAQVTAAPHAHRDATYELAGPERLTTTQMAEQVSDVTGRKLTIQRSATPPPPVHGTSPQVQAEAAAMFAKYDTTGYPGNPNVLRFLLGRQRTPLKTTTRRELQADRPERAGH